MADTVMSEMRFMRHSREMRINLLCKMKNKNIIYTIIGGTNRHF